jgi:hypothetical protein
MKKLGSGILLAGMLALGGLIKATSDDQAQGERR